MKSITFAILNILCMTGTAAAQQGWVALTSGTAVSLDCISLVGRDTVYVGGGVLLRSTDAGASWQMDNAAPHLGGYGYVHFFDANNGVICGSSDEVYTTTNGGLQWDTGHTGLLTKPVGIAGSEGLAAFSSIRNGSVMAGNILAYTNDGNISWHSSAGGAGGQFNCMTFADSVHAYAMGLSTYWNNGNNPFAPDFERTSNGGATWDPVYPGPSVDAQGHPHSGMGNKDIYGIAAISVDTLIAVGFQIGRTFDAGADWDTLKYPGADEFNSFNAVYFPDALYGTAVGTSGWIYHTSDGGATWQKQNSGITGTTFLNAVSFIDSLTGYTVGDGGTILKTINGGLSWVQLFPGLDSVQLSVSPNPSNSQTYISYGLPETQHVTLSILDLSGNVVSQVLNGALQDGPQRIRIDVSHLACGIYFARVQSEKYSFVIKFEVACS